MCKTENVLKVLGLKAVKNDSTANSFNFCTIYLRKKLVILVNKIKPACTTSFYIYMKAGCTRKK